MKVRARGALGIGSSPQDASAVSSTRCTSGGHGSRWAAHHNASSCAAPANKKVCVASYCLLRMSDSPPPARSEQRTQLDQLREKPRPRLTIEVAHALLAGARLGADHVLGHDRVAAPPEQNGAVERDQLFRHVAKLG